MQSSRDDRPKLSDTSLLNSDQFYRTLFQSANDGIFIMDEMYFLVCNPKALEMYGAKEEEIIGKSPLDFSPSVQLDGQKSIDSAQKKLKDAFDGNPQTFEWVHHKLSGGLFNAEVKLNRFPVGDKYYIQAIVRDITDKKRSVELLQENEEYFRSLVEANSDWIWEVDAEGRYQYSSPNVYNVLGYHPDELLGHSPFEFMEKDEAEKIGAIFLQAVQNRESLNAVVNKVRHKDGHLVVFETSGVPVFDENNDLVGYRGIDRDISLRIETENQIKQNQKTINSIIQAAPVGIGLICDHVLHEVNDQLCDLSGYSKEELIGQKSEIFYPDEKSYLALNQIKYNDLEKKGSSSIETKWQRKDGQIIDVLMNAAPVDAKDLSQGITITIMDITERKSLEARLKIAVDVSSDLIYEWDMINEKVTWFGDIDGLLGFKQNEFPRTVEAWTKRIHPQDREDLKGALKLFETTAEEIQNEYRVQKKGGDWLYWKVHSKPVLDDNAKPVKWIGVCINVTEQKMAEAALFESENKYRSLIETTDTGYCILNMDGEILDANSEYVRMTGHQHLKQILGRSIMEWTAEYDLERNREEFGKFLQNGYVRHLKVDYVGPSGDIIPIEINSSIIQAGSESQILTVCHDISYQRENEQELMARLNRIQLQEKAIVKISTDADVMQGNLDQASRMITQLVSESMNVDHAGIWILDKKDDILSCLDCFQLKNKAHKKQSKLLLENYPKYHHALKHERVIDVHDMKTDPRTSELIDDYFKFQDTHSVLFAPVRVTGELVGVISCGQSSMYRDWQPDEILFIGEVADQIAQIILNHQRNDAMKSLQVSEGKFRTMLTNLPDAVTVTDMNGYIVDCNDAAIKLHGYSHDELIGMKAVKLVAPDFIGQIEKANITSVQTGKVLSEEVELLRKSGDSFPAEVTVQTILDNKNQITGLIGISKDITERRQIERKIRDSEVKFRSIFESIPMGMFIYHLEDDNRLIFKDFNPTARDLLGVACEPFIGKKIEEAFPALVNTILPDSYRNVARSGALYHNEDVYYDENRIIGTFDVYAFQYAPNQIVVAFTDITDRKLANEALRLSELRYREVVENATEAIFIVQNMEIAFCNPKMSEIFGYTIEEMMTKTGTDLIHPEDLSLVIQRYDNRLQGNETESNYAFRIFNYKKEMKWAEIHAVRIQWNDQPAILCFLNDITDRRLAEIKLKDSELRYRSLFNNLQDGVSVMSVNGDYIEANQAFFEMVGYNLDELKKMNYEDITPKKWRNIENALIDEVVKRGYSRIYEKEYVRKDHSVFPVELSIYLLKDSNGDQVTMVGVVRDITERKKAEEAMITAERSSRLASLGTLAAGIAHEVNQPLTALKVKVDGLIYWSDSKPELLQKNLVQNLQFVSDEAEKISDIIKHMRSLVTQEKLESPISVELNHIIDRGLSMIQQKIYSMQIELNMHLSDLNPTIKGHPTPVERVIINLVMNAANALDKVRRKQKRISISTFIEDEWCILEVSDNGPGIKEELLQRIFDPFFTTSKTGEGMGLGLSIIQNLVSTYGGTISVQNNQKQGATFTVKFPQYTEV